MCPLDGGLHDIYDHRRSSHVLFPKWSRYIKTAKRRGNVSLDVCAYKKGEIEGKMRFERIALEPSLTGTDLEAPG